MGVFSMRPKSFKMERETPFANHLKTLIHNHLLKFGPHSDDVLAEYITVLVCNGKDQNQTMVDVEAFLGKRSREFVSWLWCLLLKSEDQLRAVTSSEEKYKISPDPSHACKENDEKGVKPKLVKSPRNNDPANLSERGAKYCPSTKPCQSDHIPTSEDHPTLSTNVVQSRGCWSRSDDDDFVRKVSSGSVKLETKLANGTEKLALQQRIPDSRTLPSHGDTSGVGSVTLLTDRPRIHLAANASRRVLPPSDSSLDNRKAQRSVWDRLGKPPKHIPYPGHEPPSHVMDKSKNAGEQSNLHKSTGQTGRISPLSRLSTDRGSRMTREAAENWNRVVQTVCPVQSVSNIGRKRHFSEVNSQTASGAVVSKRSDDHPEEVRQARKRPEMQTEVSHAVVPHMEEVKRRLRRVEIEMTKLRSMQSRIEKDGKPASCADSGKLISGVMKSTDEDIESKTILVTNVHNKATKEALTAYFQRCGSVVNVVILDDIPLQRSAYITFQSKESTDMALGLSGRVFYSRTMMVSRKGDAARPSLPRFDLAPHSMTHVTADKHPFSSSHLQWRRESVASTDEPRQEASRSSSQRGPSSLSVSETGEPCFTTSVA